MINTLIDHSDTKQYSKRIKKIIIALYNSCLLAHTINF